MKINIEKIRIDGDTQSRESLKEATILDYTEKVLAGEIFKPIKIIYDGKDWWLADGFHRYFAHKRAKVNTIDADISNGTKRDAWIYSLSANGKHGLPRSNEDKRRSVMRALNDIELCDKTNIEIAKICDVSDMTVGRIRKELELLKEAKKKPKTKPVEPPKEEYIQDEVHELRTENQALLTENTKLRDQMAIGVLEIDDEERRETCGRGCASFSPVGVSQNSRGLRGFFPHLTRTCWVDTDARTAMATRGRTARTELLVGER